MKADALLRLYCARAVAAEDLISAIPEPVRESHVLADILTHPLPGSRLWRNNVGCAWVPTARGLRRLRFGLAPGSSDVIGITPVLITAEMVGTTVGVFTAIEVKAPGRVKRYAPRQRRFIDLIARLGGFAGFATSRFAANTIQMGGVGDV